MSTKKEIFQCSDCGMHYKDANMAKKCYEYCKNNKACSIEITKHSIERLQSISKQSRAEKP